MKLSKPIHPKRKPWWQMSILAACAVATLNAADPEPAKEPAPAEKAEAKEAADKSEAKEEEKKKEEPELTPEQFFEGGANTFNNWVELTTGGYFLNGNKPQFQQRQRGYNGAFGGIEDLHYQQEVAKETILTIDGRALFDLNDYKLRLDLTKDKVGYVRVSYDEFRTWYDADGGYFPQTGAFYGLSENALSLDRGKFTFETGMTLENKPKIVFRYDRQFREGQKGSTIWGIAHPSIGVTRLLSPSFYDVDERSNAFQLDISHTIKNTALGLGLRYEIGEINNSLNITQSPGEPAQQKVTQSDDTAYNLFSAHAYTETWVKDNKVMFSSGFSFSDLDNDFTGSRIYGSDFDVNYVPNALNGAGFTGLSGGSRLREYVMNLNLLVIAKTNLTIVPSLRVQREDTDASFTAGQTLGVNPIVPIGGSSEREVLDVRERLDLRYTGITNWVLFSRAEWTQGDGNLTELGGTGVIGAAGTPPINRKSEDNRFFQKYSVGARWYPLTALTLDAEGYYKINDYDYDHLIDSTANNSANRYPAYLVMHKFETYDAHLGMTLRPWQRVTIGSRYEYQTSSIYTEPDTTFGLAGLDTSDMTSHILSQNVSWTPWSRLYLQAGFDYVISSTETPTSQVTQSILEAQNNYWVVTFSPRLVIDDKTDLNVAYFYYDADNYQNNSTVGVPYGAGAREHEVTATVVRRISENLRVKLKYGYFSYSDDTFGGHKNYHAHGVSSSLQYRF